MTSTSNLHLVGTSFSIELCLFHCPSKQSDTNQIVLVSFIIVVLGRKMARMHNAYFDKRFLAITEPFFG